MKNLGHILFSLVVFQTIACAELNKEDSIKELFSLLGLPAQAELDLQEIEIMLIEEKKEAILAYPNQPEEQKKEVIEEFERLRSDLHRALSWENLKPKYIAIFESTFSDLEIEAMVEFFGSEIGQTVAKKRNALTEKINQLEEAEVLPAIQEIYDATTALALDGHEDLVWTSDIDETEVESLDEALRNAKSKEPAVSKNVWKISGGESVLKKVIAYGSNRDENREKAIGDSKTVVEGLLPIAESLGCSSPAFEAREVRIIVNVSFDYSTTSDSFVVIAHPKNRTYRVEHNI